MERENVLLFSLLLACCHLGLPADSDIVFDLFEYGKEFKKLSSVIKFIGPSKNLSEVCEGESFMLQCPKDKFIKLAKNSAIQFGRNGEWEAKTGCGGGAVDHCTTVNAKKQILSMCEGKEVCGSHLYGFFKGKDPCPAKTNRWNIKSVPDRARKYLTVRFSCEKKEGEATLLDNSQEEKSSTYKTSTYTSAITSPTSAITESYDDDTQQLENALFDKLNALSEINEETGTHVAKFLENALNSIQHRSALDDSAPKTTMLNLTERVSNKLMDMLDDQNEISEFEVKTSQMTLKLVKKKFKEGGESKTKWSSSDKRIILPDQVELVNDQKKDKLEIRMAAFNNLKEEFESASDVITVSVNKHVNLSKPVTFLLPNNGDTNVSCAFWSFSQDIWSKDGCTTVCHNETHTMCSCDHLTNFALIFNVHEEFVGDIGVHATQLKYITYVGFTISIFCMILTIIVFISQRRSHTTDRDVIHVNLCISLLTAEVIFMFGINETSNPSLCSLIAALLHYFFLASFAWMLLEGYQIYVMLVKVFESSKSLKTRYFFLCYIIPFLIVLLSFTIDYFNLRSEAAPSPDEFDMCYEPAESSSYGTPDYCWLKVDNHFVLSFIIPAVIVIFSNIGFLSFAIHSMLIHKSSTSNNHSLIVSYMKGVGVLMCLLGSTWIFGLLFLAINSLFLAYAFTILNSLQGVGIFVFQCLLNPQIHSVLRRRIYSFVDTIGMGDSLGWYQKTGTTEAGQEETEKEEVQVRDLNDKNEKKRNIDM